MTRALAIDVGGRTVSALYDRPDDAEACLVLAHGAGAGMRHAFMHAIASALGHAKIATLRFQFPYMEASARRPDPPSVLHATVHASVARSIELAGALPVFAGGKSMGGRMTSLAASTTELASVRGVVFFGFPLHPAGEPSDARAAHLFDVRAPMLFLQGTRDALAELSLLRPVVDRLGSRATLHVVDGADHGFAVLKRSRRTDAEVIDELASTAAAWMRALIAR